MWLKQLEIVLTRKYCFSFIVYFSDDVNPFLSMGDSFPRDPLTKLNKFNFMEVYKKELFYEFLNNKF